MTAKRNLSTLLTSGIVAIVVLAFAVFSAAAYWLVIEPLQVQRARAEVRRAADQTAASILSIVGSSERSLQNVAAWGLQGLYSMDEVDRLVKLFAPVIKYRRQIHSVQFADDTGREILVSRNPDGNWRTRVVNAARSPDRHTIATWSSAGELLGEETEYVHYDPREQNWFKAGTSLEQDLGVAWDAPYMFDDGYAGMPVVSRWKPRMQGPQYVLAFNVSLADLTALTRGTTVGNTGRVAATTLYGNVIAVPNDPSMSSPESIRGALLRPARESGFEATANAYDNWASKGRSQRNESEFSAYAERWVADVREARMGSQQLLVIASAPVADFALISLRSGLIAAAILAAVLAAAAAAAATFSRRVGGSVRALVAESVRIGHMDLEAPVRLATPAAELDQLVDAQERMRGRLLDATRNLEARVEERTRELAHREAETRLLVESNPQGIYGINAEGRFTFMNAAGLRILGFDSFEEIRAKGSHPLIHHHRRDGSEYAATDCAIYKALQRNQAMQSEEEVFWRKDGKPVDVSYSAAPLLREGKHTGSVISFVDITERRAAQEALADERALFQNILDKSPVSIAITSQNVIRFVNPIVNEKFGFKVGDPAPKVYVREADRDALIEILKRDGIVQNREVQMWSRDKRKLDMLVTFLPIPYEGQTGILAWLMDITERKQAENELKERMEDLERFGRLTVDREEKMIQLKEEINGLLEQMGKEEKYKIVV